MHKLSTKHSNWKQPIIKLADSE